MNRRLKRILLIGTMHSLVYAFFLPKIILPTLNGDGAKLFIRIFVTIIMVTITIAIVRRDKKANPQ